MGLVKIDAMEADTATTFNARAGLDPRHDLAHIGAMKTAFTTGC